MSQFHEVRDITVVSGAAFQKGCRLKIGTDASLYADSGYDQSTGSPVADVCGASEKSILSADRESYAAGEFIMARGHRGGTSFAIASGAIDAGAEIYAASYGRVASSGSVFEGHALEAATAAGDVIEVAYC